jgi:ribose transport system substrate-binding protein
VKSGRPNGSLWLALFGCCAVVGLIVSGCGGGGSSSSSSSAETAPGTSEGSAGKQSGAAEKELEVAYKGYFTKPPTSPNPAVKDKSILILSSGQQAEITALIVAAAKEAAEAIGWSVKICDGKQDVGNYGKCMAQANAEHVDGVLSEGVDCPYIRPQLEEGIKDGMFAVAQNGWDCSEIESGAPSLYHKISYGDRFKNEVEAYETVARGAAAWTAVEAGEGTEILYLTNQEFSTLKFLQNGYSKGIEQFCTDCQLNEVEWLGKELGTALQSKTSAALLRYPDTGAVYANTNPELGPAAAVSQAGKADSLPVIGGLGFGANFEEIRNHEGLSATMAIPSEWQAWAEIDTLNSLFADHELRDEGLGGIIVDADHNLPPAPIKGYLDPPGIDYKADYEKDWGV